MAVIGLGNMGKGMSLRTQPRFAEECELIAVCEPRAETLREIGEQRPGVALYEDYRDMLEREELDLLYIAVPPSLHRETAEAAMAKGIHVFCEKPLASRLEEAEQMRAAAEAAGVVSAVHFSFPLDPAVREMRRLLLEERRVGEIESMELILEFPQWPRAWQQNDWITTRAEGGFLLEVGIHWIHMIQQLFGDIVRVRSQVAYGDGAESSETEAEAELTLADGKHIRLTGRTHGVAEERVSMVVRGSEGVVALENWRRLLAGRDEASLEPVDVIEDEGPLPLLRQVLRRIRGEEAIVYDFADGVKAQAVLEALHDPAYRDGKDLG
ncbi:Gfo/Idh/MocA family oxidoreductase [Paenibacillus albicereus]|uniref:Gfo/Idh/MocA family oxidoreductase n=2 Tax=Paenibacillus albicereus TaxID=2726185 RepID=A0A6H2H4D1_9BACL|nr:Gfo/Idh/MocA family oxidoreductase [Paenibacillus albicereus]